MADYIQSPDGEAVAERSDKKLSMSQIVAEYLRPFVEMAIRDALFVTPAGSGMTLSERAQAVQDGLQLVFEKESVGLQMFIDGPEATLPQD